MSTHMYKKTGQLLLLFLCCVTTLKILIVGYDIDEKYAVTMSYRILQGDLPLLDMWEPHQTSGFLSALLMLPFLFTTGTTTGVVLWLRICGLLMHLGVTYCLYKVLRHDLDKQYSFLLCCIYFFSLPKLMFLPEFSNMQSWFLMLTCLCLLKYYHQSMPSVNRGKQFWLIVAGFFMALEVLTYPSTIFVFVICICSIIHYRSHSRSVIRELVCFALPCVVSALLFLGILLSYMPFSELLELLPIVASDGSHSATLTDRILNHGHSLLELGGFFVLYALAASLLFFLLRRKVHFQGISILWFRLFFLCALFGQIIIWLFADHYPNYPLAEYFFLPLFYLLFALFSKRKVTPLFTFLVVMPLVAFSSVILLSNHPIMVSLPFLSPCIVGILALPSFRQLLQLPNVQGGARLFTLRGMTLLWVLVILFGRGYMIRTSGGLHYTVFHPISIMREGAAAGIIADTETVRRYRNVYYFLNENIEAKSKVFYLGTSSDIYLYGDIAICTPSTISSPTFDEKINRYFELHPEKEPDYVICDTDLYTNYWIKEYLSQHCDSSPIAANDYIMIFRFR